MLRRPDLGTLPLGILFSLGVTALSAQDVSRMHYRVDARIDVEMGVIAGNAQVTLPPNAGVVAIEVGRIPQAPSLAAPLEIMSVRTANGEDVALDWSDDHRFATLVFSGTHRITIEYRAPLSETSREYQGHYLFTDESPGGHWYPFISPVDTTDELVDLAFSITMPRDVAAVSCANGTETVALPDGSTRVSGSVQEVPSCFLAIGPGFEIVTRDVDGTSLVLFHDPGDDRNLADALVPAAEALAWYKTTLGFFPAEQVTLLPASRGSVGATSFPGAMWLHRGELGSDFLQGITAHELGHFYWGMYVRGSPDRLYDWLMLANGIWLDQLYQAQRENRSVPEQWRRPAVFNRFAGFLRARARNYDQRLGIDSREAQDLNYDYGTAVRHAKGAVGLYLLAQRLGITKYLELQRELIRRYARVRLTPDAFAAALEDHGLHGAATWLAAWMRGDATIEFGVQAIDTLPSPTGFRYRIDVEQIGTIDYPVTIGMIDDRGELHRATLGEAEGSVEFTSPAPLSTVVVDPDGIIPMFSSGNAEVRRMVVAALRGAGIPDTVLRDRAPVRDRI